MFLTLQDPRARVKGSRDALGVQPIWTAFARQVIANLTTVTDSLRGFTVLLLGRYFGDRLIREGKIEEADVVDAFLRMEQLCGYARCLGPSDDEASLGRILGIERIMGRINRRSGSVRIGISAEAAILSDQKSYGLWGLFSVAARASKLLPDGPVGLSPDARAFVEAHYLPPLDPALTELMNLIAGEGTVSLEPLDPVLAHLRDVVAVRPSAAERDFYRRYLCDGTGSDQLPPGRQRTFRRLLQTHSALRRSTSRADFVSIRKAAQQQDPELARRIGDIIALESLLAPCDALFAFLQARHGQPVAEVAATLNGSWGSSVPNLDPDAFEEILGRIDRVVGADITGQMARVHGSLLTGQYRTAIEHLLEWNRIVMMNRSSSPWVRMDAGQKLRVRYRGLERGLPTAEAVKSLWRYTYFVDTLKALVVQTSEPSGRNAS